MKKTFPLWIALVVLAGCDGSRTYEPAWFDVYGRSCGSVARGPRPGCNFYADERKIIVTEDPYYTPATTFEFNLYYYFDSYGESQFYLGWAWKSPNGILYTDRGQALNAEDETEGRDILESVAGQEEQMIRMAGADFSSRFALQEEKGVEVARTLNAWATLVRDRKVRVRTEADIRAFSKRLFGLELDQAVGAAKSFERGDLSQAYEARAQVAAHWETSPETAGQILKSWYTGRK